MTRRFIAMLCIASFPAFLFAFLAHGAGPTIADVKATAPLQQSLWEFLLKMPGTLEAQIFYALEIFGLMGITCNYMRLWLTEQISGNLWCYLVHQYPRRTILTVGAYTAWSIGLLSTSTFVGEGGTFVGWMNVIIFALTNGYGADSLANKGSPPARDKWTDEMRAIMNKPQETQP